MSQISPVTARELAEELREYTAMKYAGDCKCGKCQLVPRELVERLYHALNGTFLFAQRPADRAAIIEECAKVAESYPSSGEQTEYPVEHWIRRLADTSTLLKSKESGA